LKEREICKEWKLGKFNPHIWNWVKFAWWYDSENYGFTVYDNDDNNIQYAYINNINLIEEYWYDEVTNMIFSDKSNHYLYVAKTWNESKIIFDWKDITPNIDWIIEIDDSYIVFWNNWNSVIFPIKIWNLWYLAHNQEIITEGYEESYYVMDNVIYSNNMETIIYHKNEVEGEQGEQYYLDWKKISIGEVWEFQLSADGKSYMFTDRSDEKTVLYKDWKVINQNKYISWIRYINNANEIAYKVYDWEKDFYIVNSKPQKEYERISNITVLEWENNYFYEGNKWNKKYVIYNGIEGLWYNSISKITYYKDQIAYIARDQSEIVVQNNKESENNYKYVWGLVFDNSTNRLIYFWRNDTWKYIEIEWKERIKYKWNWNESIVFQDKFIKPMTFWDEDIVMIDNDGSIIQQFDNWDIFPWIAPSAMKNYVDIHELYKDKYDKFNDIYVSQDKQNILFIWIKNKEYFIVKNWEEKLTSDNIINELYPIDWGESYIYGEYKNWVSDRLIVCE
jgi:hypothetical protein